MANSCRNVDLKIKEGQPSTAIGEKRIVQEKDGKFRNLLKKSYLRHLVGNLDSDTDNADARLNYEGNFNQRKAAINADFARLMKILFYILSFNGFWEFGVKPILNFNIGGGQGKEANNNGKKKKVHVIFLSCHVILLSG